MRLKTAAATLSTQATALRISVGEATVSFVLDGVEVLSAPIADVDVVGTSAVWVSDGDAQVESLTITTPGSCVQ